MSRFRSPAFTNIFMTHVLYVCIRKVNISKKSIKCICWSINDQLISIANCFIQMFIKTYGLMKSLIQSRVPIKSYSWDDYMVLFMVIDPGARPAIKQIKSSLDQTREGGHQKNPMKMFSANTHNNVLGRHSKY